jgi:hypothetical protein
VRNHSRWIEVEARFPGLLAGIINAYASDEGSHSHAAVTTTSR